ncbi:SpoIIE family protein phosphatase [Nonomuraea salmonea]
MGGDALSAVRPFLEPMLLRTPMAIAVWDRDLRCVWRNDAARALQHVFPYYQVGRALSDLEPGLDTRGARQAMLQVLADGVPRIDREAHWTSPGRSEEHKLSTSFFRLEDADGRPVGLCSMVLDIGHSHTRDRLTLLHEASIRIGSTLDVRRTAQELADLAVPALADYVTVDLAEAVLPGAEPLQRLEATEDSVPAFYRAGVASIHDGVPESLWERGEAVFVPPSSPFTMVLDSGRSHFEPFLDTAPGTWLDRDPDRAEIIHAVGMHSLIIVPLKARGDILGVAVFVRTDNKVPFAKSDLALAEGLGARTALSLDNARQYTLERTAALALQRNMLPPRLTGTGEVELASRYMPSDLHDVGGDWYDAIPLPDGRIALVVGDVTGHGIHAAATMGRLRMAVRTLAYVDQPPCALLNHLDDMLVRLADESADACGARLGTAGATCLYAVYDPATGRCRLASAGHPPPAVVHPDGTVSFPRPPTGTPIGLGFGMFDSLEVDLPPGSRIVLYTDGLIETREADIEAGIDRLGVALAAAARLPLEDFCDAVVRTMVGGGAEDDVALLAAQIRR